MQTQTANDGPSASDEIANLKEQRESAEEKIQQMTDEKGSLMEELKVSTAGLRNRRCGNSELIDVS